jgi:3-oxoadipate enol-lactonase
MANSELRLVGPAPRVAVECQGAGPLVLFLHGVGGNRRNWRDQLPAFAAAGFQAAAWDARGYLDSDDHEGPLAVGDFVADLIRVLDAFGAKTAHIVGLSMGGLIAMEFGLTHPGRVASLVLCDTSPGFSEGWSPAETEAFLDARRKPLLEGKEPRDIAPGVARSLVGPAASEEAYQRLVASMSALRKDSYIKALVAITKHKLARPLEAITAPTLVLCGTDDKLTPPALSRRIHERIRGSRLVLIARAGHLSNIEQPQAFNDAVLGFLRGLA